MTSRFVAVVVLSVSSVPLLFLRVSRSMRVFAMVACFAVLPLCFLNPRTPFPLGLTPLLQISSMMSEIPHNASSPIGQ